MGKSKASTPCIDRRIKPEWRLIGLGGRSLVFPHKVGWSISLFVFFTVFVSTAPVLSDFRRTCPMLAVGNSKSLRFLIRKVSW